MNLEVWDIATPLAILSHEAPGSTIDIAVLKMVVARSCPPGTMDPAAVSALPLQVMKAFACAAVFGVFELESHASPGGHQEGLSGLPPPLVMPREIAPLPSLPCYFGDARNCSSAQLPGSIETWSSLS